MKKIAALVCVPLLALSLSACSGSEGASKEDVAKGLGRLTESALDQAGLPGFAKTYPEVFDEYEKCVVDKSYESLSAETRDILAKGASDNIEDLKIPKEDAEILMDSFSDEECNSILADGILNGMSEN